VTSQLIFWAFFVSIAALLALVALDRRQPARRQRLAPRGGPLPQPPAVGGARRAPGPAAVVQEAPATRYKRTPLWRRLLAVVGLGAISAILGALLAIVVAAAVIAAMLWLAGAAR
jgi:hypothetical protein